MSTVTSLHTSDFYRVLFDHSSDAHFIMNQGEIIDCNVAAIELLGCSTKADVLHLHPATLSPETQPNGKLSRDESQMHDAIAREKGWHRFEWIHRKINGEMFPVEVTLNAISIDDKEFTLVVWHDLTLQKQYEEKIVATSNALQAANNKLHEDLEAAALVQRSLMPRNDWKAPGLATKLVYLPSEQLSGDILNIFQLRDGLVWFYCLDVTGHGVAASLLAVIASHLLSPFSHHSLVKHSNDQHFSPREVLTRLNQEFQCHEGRLQFMTITYGVIDVSQKKMNYACAGHPGPILVKSHGEVKQLDHPGFPIGIVPDASYEEHELFLEAGDRIYIYSDGLPEAQSSGGQFFEVKQLLSNLLQYRKLNLSCSVRNLTQAVESWCSPARPRDDISVMGLELCAT
jgi:PAS domain S-box-containing protein